MRFLITIICCLFFLIGKTQVSSLTQPSDSLSDKNKSTKWGIIAIVDLNKINFYSNIEGESVNAFNSNLSSVRIGGFYSTPRTYSELNVGYEGIQAQFKGFLKPNIFAYLGVKESSFNDLQGNRYYGYNPIKINFIEYQSGLGIILSLKKEFQIELKTLVGRIRSDPKNSYLPWSHYIGNKVASIQYSSFLEPTLQFGGGFRITVPNTIFFNKTKNLNFFMGFEYLTKTKANYLRSILIEEWIPGNIVYKEDTNNNTYLLENYALEIGIIWTFQ